MASAKLFEAAPPFPDDVPVADIPKVSLAKLVQGDKDEAKAMFDSCCTMGFFLLDLAEDPVGQAMIEEIDKIFGVMQETMHLSLEEKQKYLMDFPRDFFGWKSEGMSKTDTGEPDRCEFYNLSQDDLLGNSAAPPRPTPAPIQAATPVLHSYVSHSQQVLTQILHQLAASLGLPRTQLRDLQAPTRASGSILRMIRYQPSLVPADMRTSFLAHTDIGTVTFLVNVLGGLQVLVPGAKPDDDPAVAWRWVKPQPHCLIVNMGDAMVEWTGGVLRSNMHRVSYSPGEQRFAERYSLALLTRPYKEASMRRLEGGRIPTLEDDAREGLPVGGGGSIGDLSAEQWELKKTLAMKEGKDCMQSRGGRLPLAV